MDFISLKFWQRGTGSKADAKAAATVVDTWWTTVKGWLAFPFTVWEVDTAPLFIVDLLAWERDITRYTGEPESLYRLRVEHAYANAKDAGSTAGFVRIWERLGLGSCFIVERPEDDDWDIVYIDMDPAVFAGNETLIMTMLNQYGRTCRRYRVSTTSVVSMSVAAPYGGFDTAFNIVSSEYVFVNPNILEYSHSIDMWGKFNTLIGSVENNYGRDCYRVESTKTSTSTACNISIPFDKIDGEYYTAQIIVHKGETSRVLLGIYDGVNYQDLIVDLDSLTKIYSSSGVEEWSIEELENEWFMLSMCIIANETTSLRGIYLGPISKSGNKPWYITASAGVYISSAQVLKSQYPLKTIFYTG
ncbi:phage head spike fiber domain-containing protein [Oceanobacter mangrovi]|uniref:phage head spike fiber domain-containing protein n=1 Tax=Oceanobacter mangrovi TaxID=2862510 RepID=UPI001C8EECE2|nr:hypothetical protein [Oceanobacter mangrovi]